MRVVIQRVKSASCIVDSKVTGKIKGGLLLFVGFKKDDTEDIILKLAKKIKKLRIFSDSLGKMNLSINESKESILSISQFTLYGNLHKTNRPSFSESMEFDKASLFYDKFNNVLNNELGLNVETGIFGANMEISLVNDGPVTIILDSETL